MDTITKRKRGRKPGPHRGGRAFTLINYIRHAPQGLLEDEMINFLGPYKSPNSLRTTKLWVATWINWGIVFNRLRKDDDGRLHWIE